MGVAVKRAAVRTLDGRQLSLARSAIGLTPDGPEPLQDPRGRGIAGHGAISAASVECTITIAVSVTPATTQREISSVSAVAG